MLSLRMDGELLDPLRTHAAKRDMAVQDYVLQLLRPLSMRPGCGPYPGDMGKKAYSHPAPEPFEGDIMAVTVGGTVLWCVLFLVQLPFVGWLDDHDRMWWLWTCLAGAGLGVLGIWYVRRRAAALARGGGADAPSNT